MPLRTALPPAKGFTLLEIAVAVGIIGILAAACLSAAGGLLERQGLSQETAALSTILIRARDYALSDLHAAAHGVCLGESGRSYVLFDTRGWKEAANRSRAVAISGLPHCADGGITFSRLSATTTGAAIVLTERDRSMEIEVNREGAISW